MSRVDDRYKVLNHRDAQIEVNLNRLARDGWKVIYSHFDPFKNQWHILLERQT